VLVGNLALGVARREVAEPETWDRLQIARQDGVPYLCLPTSAMAAAPPNPHHRLGLKGAFIQIMPLTWDSFLLPGYPRLECLRLENRELRGVPGKTSPCGRAWSVKTDS
jgi:hypothetical protein